MGKGEPSTRFLRSNYIYNNALIRSAIKICFALSAEFNEAHDARKKRVIRADADVTPRHNFGTALADDDFSNAHLLTVSTFDAEVLRV